MTYTCPGGCGRPSDSGNWCGICSWVAGMRGFQSEELERLRTQPWPFDWKPPAKAWYAP